MNTELDKNEKLSMERKAPPIANVLLGDVLCDVEVNNKESNYFRYRTCKNKAKYKIYYKYKGTSRTEGMPKIVCERHKKMYEKEMEVMKVENIA